MSTTIVYATDPSKDVSIAGNFTDWAPVKLSWNDKTKGYEYIVTTKEKSGKLNFKFIVDGNWVTDQNYASEFDEMGNENNVILYDHTEEKKALSKNDQLSEEAVAKEISDEPTTPDPTPAGIVTPSLMSTENISLASITASKSVPKTASPVPTKTSSEPVTTTATTSGLSEPKPESRPSISEPTSSAQSSKVADATPQARPSGSTTHAPVEEEHAGDESQNTIAKRPEEEIPKDWSFFSKLLHLIAEFFRQWFHR